MKTKKVLIAALLVSSLLANESVSYADTLVKEESTEIIENGLNNEEVLEDNETLNENVENEKSEHEDNKEINITDNTPSEEEVKEYWHNYESKGQVKEEYNGIELTNQDKDIYEVEPNLETKEKGSLKQSIIDDTIHIVNTFRYSIGLDPVEEDKELSQKAQAGAFINYANYELSHYPKTPENFTDEDQVVKDGKLANSESNLAQSYKIYDAVGGYMDDEDPSNNKVLGHRRWLMNPFLKRIGIGQVEDFNNIYVADDSALSFNNDNIVTYPTKVNFTEFINPRTPFSVNLGVDYKIENIDNVKVVVTDKDGNITTYTKDNGLFYDNGSYGNSTALIFGNELSKEKGSEYNIKVIGLKANEKDFPIEYTSKFISVNDKKKVVIPATEIEDIAKPIEKPSIPWTEIEDNAEPIEEEKPSIPWTEIEDNAEIIEEEKPSIPWTEIEDNAEIIEGEKPSIPWTEIEDNAEIIEEEKPSIPWTEIEDNAEIIEDNKDDGKEDSPSKDKEDDKSIPWTKIEDNAEIIEEEKPSEKIIIPAVKIEDIAKSIEKESSKNNKEKSKEDKKSLENKEKEINDSNVENVKPIANVQTGITGIGAVLTTLSAAAITLFKSKRK